MRGFIAWLVLLVGCSAQTQLSGTFSSGSIGGGGQTCSSITGQICTQIYFADFEEGSLTDTPDLKDTFSIVSLGYPQTAVSSTQARGGSYSVSHHFTNGYVSGTPATVLTVNTTPCANSLGARTAYIRYTVVVSHDVTANPDVAGSWGESSGSAEYSSVALDNTTCATFSLPTVSNYPGAMGIFVYAGYVSGTNYKQEAVAGKVYPHPLAATVTEPTAGFTTTGSATIPQTASSGGSSGGSNRYTGWTSSPTEYEHFVMDGWVYVPTPTTPSGKNFHKLFYWNPNVSAPEIHGTVNVDEALNIEVFFNATGANCVGGQTGTWQTVANFAYNTWQRITLEVKLNTPGSADGYADLWVDGVHAACETFPVGGACGVTHTIDSLAIRGTAACTMGGKVFHIGEQSQGTSTNYTEEYRYWDDIGVFSLP